MALEIDADFDSGNIAVTAIQGDEAELAIRPDNAGKWFQWFHFRVRGGAGRCLTLRLTNAGASSYPEGWPGYRARVSEDGHTWLACDTSYDGKALTITHTPHTNEVRFAYFAPYAWEQHEALVKRMATVPGITHRSLGQTLDGRPLDCLEIGTGGKQVWIIARQHPGESMASWWMEGALPRLATADDPVVKAFLARARLHIVPLVNPDGARRGNLRTNAAGKDLNRQWRDPDPGLAPEVHAILSEMDRTGVDLFFDVHGDEGLPHVFIDGCDVDPEATPEQVAGVDRFRQALLKLNPAFQTKEGYPPSYGGPSADTIATRAIGLRFKAVAMTLEMPFKNSREVPEPETDWSPQACKRLGHDCVQALNAVLDA